MAQAYTPGLQFSEHTVVRKLRELPLPGKSLVRPGDRVQANSIVLTAELPGDIDIIRVADRMGLDPIDVSSKILVKPGDEIRKGNLLCRTETFFGFFTSKLESPVDGTVEFVTEANAHIGVRRAPIPLEVQAYIDGTVVEVDEGKSLIIETEAMFFQGIFGVGGERLGRLKILDVARHEVVQKSDIDAVSTSLSGSILVGGSAFSLPALQRAGELGVRAVVTGSIDDQTLYKYVGHHIGVSITGDEKVPATLVATEGFGRLPLSERVLELAARHEGQQASVNGATQVRAGAMRPEVIVPMSGHDSRSRPKVEESSALEPGTRIRVIRIPYFGEFGTVLDLPSEPKVIESGAKVRVLRAKLDNSQEVVVPRANVEILK